MIPFPLPFFVSLLCAFRSRSWADSTLVRRCNRHRPLRTVPLLPSRDWANLTLVRRRHRHRSLRTVPLLPSRDWANLTLVRRRHLHRSPRSVRLLPCRRVRVRFARGWIGISRRFVWPPTTRPSTPDLLSERPSSKSKSNDSRRWFVFASSNSLDASPRPRRRRLQRPRIRPAPTRRRVGRAASNPAGQVPSDAITPTFRPSRTLKSFRRRSAVARGAVSRSPTSPAPRIPSSWRSRSGPIAGSFAAAVTVPRARAALIPASSRPHRRPG